MAALANVYRLFDREDEPVKSHAPKPESTRVRAFANEDVYFFIKRIDNSGVVRESDPQTRRVCWKLIGSAGAAVILLIAVLLPSAYSLLAGYQIQSLKQEQTRLIDEQASLELLEAQLLSPQRMEELAKQQHFVDPPADGVVYLNKGGALAMVEPDQDASAGK
jgi:hypothetical protein